MTATTATTPSQFSVRNPATGEQIGTLPIMGRDEVQAAVDRARAAQPAWEASGVHVRAELLRRWSDAVLKDRFRLMQLIRRETGKSDPSAFVEVLVLDNIASYYAKHAPRILKPQSRMPVFPLIHRAHVYYRPYGVAGFITPWNYPYFNGLSDLIPALMAGNSVVLKPSEVTPYVAIYAVEKMIEVGFPRDVIQIV